MQRFKASSRCFSSRLAEYTNPEIDVFNKEILSNKYTIVNSVLKATNERPEVKIDWRIYTKNPSNPLIRDLIIAQCTGPQFETPSEIDVLVKLGADVVGMTLGPEQRLVSETNIPHVALACSSNWAAGRTPGNPKAEINHNEVDSMASSMREKVMNCVVGLIEKF